MPGRGIARHQEEGIWMPVPASYGGRAKYRTAHVGSLVGLEGDRTFSEPRNPPLRSARNYAKQQRRCDTPNDTRI